MPKPYSLKINDIFTISGAQIPRIYRDNKMTVHFQGMSKTIQFPQTIALQGAPTCSIGISPDGLYNRLNDSGRLILLYQKAIQFASAPFIRIGNKTVMLTTKRPEVTEGLDEVPVAQRYYHPPVSESRTSISIATPLLQMAYKLSNVQVIRKMICPFLSGDTQALMPVGVEEYEVRNTKNQAQQITLVMPRPSLVNLQEKKLRPVDQDNIYTCSTAVRGHVHEDFTGAAIRGVVMASKQTADRMAIAVPEMKGVTIDTQACFRLNSLRQDLLLNDDGSFYEKREPTFDNDYGAAISVTFQLKPKATIKIPFAIVLDFPEQKYNDGEKFARKYTESLKDEKTRATDMAKIALENYPKWLSRTLTIQSRIFDRIRQSPSYKNDKTGALRLARLIFNEFSFPLSNAAVWVEDKDGNDVARFLECFDYPYINPSDVDWYSMMMLILFPDIEKELCQRFIDSILTEDLKERYYHIHASFPEARKHFEDHPEQYEGYSLTQIKDTFKIRGSVAHDLGAMTAGHALRNVSDYAWYNSNYWVDLFPKLALRVLRNVKFTSDTDFLKRNWKTLKIGFEFLQELDVDEDGVPEGNPDEVKNTFDNITLFGVDCYCCSIFLAGCRAMIRLADMMKDKSAKKLYEEGFEKASAVYETLWTDKKNSSGRSMRYYATCYDPDTGKTNTDVWTNQLDGLWSLIAMGEEPFISDDRARKILKTIYMNNRTLMGWATARTINGKPVESDQGKDVWIASNYVLAQMLDYYGLVNESKQVYKVMDKVIFQHANSLITPDGVRPELEKEEGELTKGPHYIVAGYPRPGAVLTQIAMQFVKEARKQTDTTIVNSKRLSSFVNDLMK